MRIKRTNITGIFLIACGMVFLSLAVLGTLYPLATVRFGPIEVSGLSQFSALTAFVGIVLVAMGIIINTGKRPF